MHFNSHPNEEQSQNLKVPPTNKHPQIELQRI